jgi:hypothetical protein
MTNLSRRPIVLAYGLGVDSTAVIVGCVQQGLPIDAILFADVGGEKDETYAFLPIINAYLEKHGYPTVAVVRYQAQNFKHYPPYATLEENCLTNGTLPSEAFGFGSCSQKWKATPQKKWLEAWAPAIATWARGEKVIRLIGFDASCADQKRTYAAESIPDARFEYRYPLQAWGWDRATCKAMIAAAGLPVPPKSSCFFCPNMSKDEVRALPADRLQRIVLMEARAKPRLTKIDGLWRTGCKGKKDPAKKKPGTMTEFIRTEGLLPAHQIDHIANNAPAELIDRMEAFANGLEIDGWSDVLANLTEGCIAV